ncbi:MULTISPECIES: type VII secretion protein EccE [Mycobacterium]|uniref:ESX-5 secretion system protein EccE5 n=1 Tax=Mycobacterium kiyosense TaxID=2871094 RepID=A0A9P3Q2W4_9MYCO|nr:MULTISPECIES: type VII secretion protein EccE [Mycobacterium]BDE14141.1 ESX-5 secretion system protein EccE5 [Mycobacterium sp. 20KCMC460]GLB82974.1 ESX-5 secretion system protein EccE5 [Mycobacterium kiyosense]GLB89185.1 ESX-5 secretion system protein EccE5 [Mycobacterium kiyosense]GLB93836.1 ESX-5 secretion system protein EccE5 [Mycobacterium kiyosense]GLC00024.1 ESX-5 secretion system protein EccE5 [Mycobacterium kiyosense]
MKAQRKFGLSLTWPRLTAVFLVDVLILVLASHAPASWQGENRVAWWIGVAIAVLVTLLSIVTYHGITVTSGLTAWLWDWSADPGTALGAGCTPANDFKRRFGRDTVGVREYRGQLVAVVEVDGGDGEHPGRHRHRPTGSAPILPVAAVADGLRQFDIQLDAIDIVSVEVRGGAEAARASASLEEWGPEGWGANDGATERTGTDRRRTWLVLRMNPQRNVAAVVCRDSLAATLVAATERLVQDLDGQSCAARPLTADELAEVDSAVLADLEPTWSRPGWRHLKHFNGYVTSFWVTPSDISTETLRDLWLSDAPEVGATVVTVRLNSRAGRPQLSAWVRYHSEGRLSRDLTAGLNRLTGRQLAAVRASLPAPSAKPHLVVPSRDLRDHDELELPVGHEAERVSSSAAQ